MLWGWSDPAPGANPISFDYTTALGFLRRFMTDPYNMVALRTALARTLSGHSVKTWNDHDILKQAARQLCDGRLCMARSPVLLRSGGGSRQSEASVEAPPSVVKPPAKISTPWIELLYLDSNLSPVAGADFHIRSQSPPFAYDGVLNANGFIHIDNVPADVRKFSYYFDHDPEPYKPLIVPSISTLAGEAYEAAVSALDDIGEWTWGTVQGDFNKDQSISQIAVNMVLGVIPLVDQALDVRDIIAGLKDIIEYYSEDEEEQATHPDVLGMNYEVWLWLNVFIIALGCVPAAGSVVKGVLRGLIRFLQDALKKAGDLTPAQIRRLWEQLISILNYYGKGNAHQWLKNLKNNLSTWIDEAAKKIDGALKSIQEMMKKAEQYAGQLDRWGLLSSKKADAIIERARKYYDAAGTAYRKLADMKRQVNNWIAEQINRMLGGKHKFEQPGSVNVRPRPRKSDPNTRVQEKMPPPEIQKYKVLANRKWILQEYGDKVGNDILRTYDEIADIEGADRLLDDLVSGDSTAQGALSEIGYAASLKKQGVEIEKVGDVIDGKKAGDILIKNGPVIDVKDYNWKSRYYRDPKNVERSRNSLLKQVQKHKERYKKRALEYAFTDLEETPPEIIEALRSEGVEVRQVTWPGN